MNGVVAVATDVRRDDQQAIADVHRPRASELLDRQHLGWPHSSLPNTSDFGAKLVNSARRVGAVASDIDRAEISSDFGEEHGVGEAKRSGWDNAGTFTSNSWSRSNNDQ